MKIHVATDHAGLDLKNKIKGYLPCIFFVKFLISKCNKLKNRIIIPKLKKGTILPFQSALSGP